ncbi:MAG: lysophospholipid acyltransferase family protein [Candidatus Omnitrophica bacterium]|nr:lysophospholipid acyltransferase family protein [Candidatus Omnitrophota bacterium]
MAKKKPYRYPLYLLARGAAFLVWCLPRPFALWIARCLGFFAFGVVLRQRKKTLKHLEFAYGREKSPYEIKIIGRQVFENLAQTAVEILRFSKLNHQKVSSLVDYGDGIEKIAKLLEEKKGLIIVTAHIGNWELLAGAMALAGFSGAVIARKIYYEPYNRWITGLRKSVGVDTLYRDQATRSILKVLSNNQIIGILPDQDVDSVQGMHVDFFNHPAYTPVAPVRLAFVSGAPILACFMIRKDDGKYELKTGEPLRPVIKTTRQEAVGEYTQQIMREFERVIRQYPDQWAWMHDRWKTQEKQES